MDASTTKATVLEIRAQRARQMIALSVAVAALALSTSALRANVIEVNTAVDNLTANDGLCTLREAIMNANLDADTTSGDCNAGSGPDQIIFTDLAGSPDVYRLVLVNIPISVGENFNARGDLDIIGNGLEIAGNGRTETIVEAGPSVAIGIDRVFDVHGVSTVGFRDMTIRHGRAININPTPDMGGGIRNHAATINLRRVDVRANGAITGGGIGNDGGGVFHVVDSAIQDNQCLFDGGGGANRLGGHMTFRNVQVLNNRSELSGGGLSNRFGDSMEIYDSLIDGNVGYYDGGGIVNSVSGMMRVERTTISNNRVIDDEFGYAGGVENFLGGTMHLLGCTIRDNRCPRNPIDQFTAGGGCANFDGGTMYLTNTTVSGNSSEIGSALYNEIRGHYFLNHVTISNNFSSNGSGSVMNFDAGTIGLANTIIADQAFGADCDNGGTGAFWSYGYNLDSDNTCLLTATGDIPAGNANLAPLQLNAPGRTATHALRPGSDAADAILDANSCGAPVDQRGVPRPQNTFCDIGAYEQRDCNSNGYDDAAEIGPGNCCAATGQTGCSNPAITACVCAGDPFCCNVAWDSICSQQVEGFGCASCTLGLDCNMNNALDECDISGGTSIDFNLNGTPDECEPGPVAVCKPYDAIAAGNCCAMVTTNSIDGGSYNPNSPPDMIAQRCITAVDGVPVLDVCTTAVEICGPGPHTCELTVYDLGGASDTCTSGVTVVDATPPTGSGGLGGTVRATPIVAVDDNCAATLGFSATISDNCCVDTNSIVLTPQVPPNATLDSITYDIQFISTNSVLVQGTLIVRDLMPPASPTDGCVTSIGLMIEYADCAGTAGLPIVSTNSIADLTPPDIVCPADVTYDRGLGTGPGFSPAEWLDQAMASDNCTATPVITNDANSVGLPCGSFPCDGGNFVTFTATDDCGNVSTCGATLTVIDSHPGWNSTDVEIELTGHQPTYWSAFTGQPAGVAPFTVLDPGVLPGRKAADGSGERVLRGFVVAWAVDRFGQEIRWNHLKGDVAIVNYGSGSAWEYTAYAFQTINPAIANGSPTGTPGTLFLNGTEYDRGYGVLLLDFYASGGTPFHIANCAAPALDSELTLMPITMDLRQETSGPVTTKANFTIWNQNEVKFTGLDRCVTCWDSTLLSQYGTPNHFLRENLQTDKGKAQIDGLASQVCDVDYEPGDGPVGSNPLDQLSVADSLIGVVVKKIGISSSMSDYAGMNLVGMGSQTGSIRFDLFGAGPDERPDDVGGTRTPQRTSREIAAEIAADDTSASALAAPADERLSASEKGSLLIFPKVELRWNAAGDTLIQDTFIDLTNDYPGDVLVQMYFVNGDPPVAAGP
ncbi:MAG: hypothetical protein H6817_03315 [Phycisphaerales bacterium]|nr:hypothetical protein [Phycisphaerales bacterium]